MSQYTITVTNGDGSGLHHFETAPTADQMEDRSTQLQREYPAPTFKVNVDTD